LKNKDEKNILVYVDKEDGLETEKHIELVSFEKFGLII
jgi:hypothetical protein